MKKLLVVIACLLFSGAAYGRTCAVANGDAQRVVDVTTTNASGAVVSASALFTCPGDAGKVVTLISSAGANLLAVNTTTISVCTDTSHVTLAANANATTVNSVLTWATLDSAAAINTQVTACKAPVADTWPAAPSTGKYTGGSAGTVTLSGGYLVTGCVYDVNRSGAGPLPSMVGSGRYNTVLFLSPVLTTCTDGPFLMYANGQGMTLQGIGVEGSYVAQNAAANLVTLNGAQFAVQDFEIRDWGNITSSGAALQVALSYSTMNQVQVQNAPGAAFNYQCNFSLAGAVLNDVFCSNGYRNVIITSGSSRTPSTVGGTWIGGGADECLDQTSWCFVVNDNAELQANGITIFGILRMQPGSVAYVTNSNVGAFLNNNRLTGANIAATAKIYSTGTTWRGNVGSSSVINNGTFVDELGNDYKTCSFSTCTSRTAAQSFTGNQPITR